VREGRVSEVMHLNSSATFRGCLFGWGALFLESGASSYHRIPSIDVFGSYFPAWLICLLFGVVLTVIASSAGRLIDIRPPGLWSPLLCVSLILIFSVSLWFLFFAS
jgi:hypothetical protein